MLALQKPYVHLLRIVDTHTFGFAFLQNIRKIFVSFTLLQNIRTFFVKGQVEGRITLPIAIIVPPCMQHMVNIHLTLPELKQLGHILPHKWDILLKNGTIDFLTRFKSTPNYFKMTFSINLGKTWLGVYESIPDDYRAECLHFYSALL